MKPAQIGALFSCFAFQEKSSENQKLPDVLLEPYKILVDVIKQVIDVENDADLQIDATAYLERFQPHLMNITYQWCNGNISDGIVTVRVSFYKGEEQNSWKSAR